MTPGPNETKMQEQEGGAQEPFLSRWSRKKQEAREQPPEPTRDKAVDPKSPVPELPPIDELTPESDFRAFFHPKVDENVRRAALKKLFSNPHFNVMDGLDTYIDDYSKTEPIPAAMLAGLKQAQDILRSAQEDREQRAQDEARQKAAARTLEPPAPQTAPEPGTQAYAPAAGPATPVDSGGQPKS
jgi:hypothetical protein